MTNLPPKHWGYRAVIKKREPRTEPPPPPKPSKGAPTRANKS